MSSSVTGRTQITERFTRAVDQLGSEKLEIRLGGIYALERIARDSKKDHWPIMEVLTAYVRENAPWPPKKGHTSQGENLSPANQSDGLQKDGQARSLPKPATDIQAILTVLGRRKAGHEKEGQELDLTKTDLRGVDLSETHLERVHLSDAHLEGALLWEAYLEKADLTGVVGLTKEQIESAIIDENTKLSDYFTEAMKSEAK